MADVKNPHAILVHTVENLERIAEQRDDMNARALGNALRGLRTLGDARDHLPHARFECGGNGFAIRETIGRDFVEVGYRSGGILDLHARRNARKAASTSR
jgi:hypothetical protein